MKDPYLQHSELVSRRSAPLSALFVRIGDCRYPPYLTPWVSIELANCSAGRVVCGRRVDFNRGCMAPGNLDSQEDKPECIDYWKVVARNADRAKRRWLGARSCSHSEPIGPVTFSEGTALDVLPNFAVATNVSSSTPGTHSRVHFIDSESRGEKAGDSGAASANPTRPRRCGGEPSFRPSQRHCTASDATRQKGTEFFGPNANCRRQLRKTAFVLRPRTLTMRGVFHHGGGPSVIN